MKKWLLAAALIITTFAAGAYAVASAREVRAFNDACVLSGYDCTDIARPVVAYDDLASLKGLLGYYSPGTYVVFIARKLNKDVEYAVMVHEMVHYLQFRSHMADGTLDSFTNCTAEREAFEVSDKILERLRLGVLARNGNLRDYGCR